MEFIRSIFSSHRSHHSSPQHVTKGEKTRSLVTSVEGVVKTRIGFVSKPKSLVGRTTMGPVRHTITDGILSRGFNRKS